MFGSRHITPPLPLPQRRTEVPAEDHEDLDNRPMIPRQRPQAAFDDDRLFEDVAEADITDDDQYADAVSPFDTAPPAAAPPVWPPVAATQPPVREETGQLQLGAGALQAAIDMTTEIPRVRELDLAGAVRNERLDEDDYAYDAETIDDEYAPDSAYAAGPGYAAATEYAVPADYAVETDFTPVPERVVNTPPASVPPFADETMELPIFRELESAWFREPDPSPAPTSADEPVPSSDQLAEAGIRLSTGETRSRAVSTFRADGNDDDTSAIYLEPSQSAGTTMGGTAMSGTVRTAEPAWRSPADEGWQAAAAAMDAPDAGTTDGGLPRRVPMAQLVPGGVDKAAPGANRRSPDAVRGLLSAYHRGVQRGRQQSDENSGTSESTTGQTQSGSIREQEA
jgi:hypothetical protein